MAQEIEHKFLVTSNRFHGLGTPTEYCQGYIPTRNGMTVRIRIAGTQGYVTFKDRTVGFTRHEFEYPIPVADARQMLDLLCEKPLVSKTRHVIPAPPGHRPDGTPVEGLHWEVDVFHGDNEGLILAEIELPGEDVLFDIPEWVGPDVSFDRRYRNNALAQHPYKDWTDEEKRPTD